MTRLLIAAIVVALAVPALADQNPFIYLYIDFDPPMGVHRIDPAPWSEFTAYFVLECCWPGGGVRAVSMLIERTFDGYNTGSTNLLGGQSLGGPEDPTGWALTGYDCVMPDPYGLVLAASADYLYAGWPGYLKIHPHPIDGQMTVDCNFLDDMYCVHANGGVCEDPPPGNVGCPDYCPPPVPVESSGWGMIKAMFR